MDDEVVERLIKDLEIASEHLVRFARKNESVLPGTALLIGEEIHRVKNSLAARLRPAKVVIALHDPVAGVDQKSVTAVGSTVPVTMFVVDHRIHHQERLTVVSSAALGEPSEVIQVVSDEASEYLQQNAELQKHITENC